MKRQFTDGVRWERGDREALAQRKKFGARAYDEDRPIKHGDGNGKLSLLYLPMLYYTPDYFETSQRLNDCVSRSTAKAPDAHRYAKALKAGVRKGKVRKAASEHIYRARQSRRDAGMSPYRGAEYVTSEGGILLRKDYPKLKVDLSTYNPKFAAGWKNSAALNKEAAKHRVGEYRQAESCQDVKDGCAHYYGFIIASYLAIKNKRNEDGFSEENKRDSWNHEITGLGYDDRPATIKKYGEALWCPSNSWKRWNSGPQPMALPTGCCWMLESVLAKCIRNGTVLIFSSVPNFNPIGKLPKFNHMMAG